MHTFTSGERFSGYYLWAFHSFLGSVLFILGYTRLVINGPEQRVRRKGRTEGTCVCSVSQPS